MSLMVSRGFQAFRQTRAVQVRPTIRQTMQAFNTNPRLSRRFAAQLIQGDPGIFGSIGKFLGGAVKTVTGVVSNLGIPVVSGVAGTVNRLVTGITGGGMQQTSVKNATAQAPGGPGIQVQLPQIGPGGLNLGGFQAGMGITPIGMGGAIVPAATGTACTVRGFHPAKDGSGRCVRNRRMNPLNPRALNRAMRRIKSAKSAARFLDRIHIGARPVRSRGGSARSGCGCGKKRR